MIGPPFDKGTENADNGTDCACYNAKSEAKAKSAAATMGKKGRDHTRKSGSRSSHSRRGQFVYS